MPPKSSPPTGLHVQLAVTGKTYRFVVWFERYRDPKEYTDSLPRSGASIPHPGCVSNPRAVGVSAPSGAPIGVHAASVLVRLPRFGNGFPVPLPGAIAGWDLAGFNANNRTLGERDYAVTGWVIPPELALGPLHQFMQAWRETHGPGLTAPQCAAVAEFQQQLLAALREGPLLPTLTVPPDAWEPRAERGQRTNGAPIGWVPPLGVAQLEELFARLRHTPRLMTLSPQGVATLPAQELPRFGRFVIELLAAAARRAEPPPPVVPGLEARLAKGDPALTELHRVHGSCLIPTHPIFAPPPFPPGALHAEIHAGSAAGNGASEGAVAPYRLQLALRDGEHTLGLDQLAAAGSVRTAASEHRGHVWIRPAAVFYRDWELTLLRRPGLLCRPELLLAGRTDLNDDEAREVLGWGPMASSKRDWAEFLARESTGPFPKGKRTPPMFTASVAGVVPRVRVRWDLFERDGGSAGDVAASVRRLKFRPALSIAVGDHDFALEEAEKLLAGAHGGLVTVRGQAIERAALRDSVDLARAREKVLRKLKAAEGVDWARMVELEDEWSESEDSGRAESLFAAAWEELLGRLSGAQGVPAVNTPERFQGDLRPYQRRGLAWMAFLASNGFGGCLADDMGLGKTVQVLALLAHRTATGAGTSRPSLVVAPTSVVLNWVAEAKRFVPTLRVHAHQGLRRARDEAEFARHVRESDLVVTSYAVLRRDAELLRAHQWDLVVVDEAQNLKNPDALQTRTAKSLASDGRLALTGTPVENRLRDLWSIFDFADPGLLGGSTRFARAFAGPVRAGNETALARLKKRVGPFLLRRTKRDPGVAAELPPRQEQDVYCELTREQVALYRAMTEAVLGGLTDKKGIERRAHILAALTHLKQICNHPENFQQDKPRKLFGRSGKLDRAMELLEELIDEGQPALVFTQYTRMGEMLVRAVEERLSAPAAFFHGGLGPDERQRIVTEFQSEQGPPVLVLSLRAGGTGINLTRATAVLHYDRWWNPAVEDQATDRAHRIGQTRTVNVYRFMTRGTLEEKIHAMLEQKRNLAREVLADADDSWVTELGDAQLRELLTLDAGDVGDDGDEVGAR